VSIPTRTVSGRWIVAGILMVTAVMVSIAAVMLFGRPRGKVAPPPSVAVLPFLDKSVDHDAQPLCNGIAVQLIDSLGGIPGFKVIAQRSAFAVKDLDLRDVGLKLNVRSVLQGSVERFGSRLHVAVDLINAADGFHLSSQVYDREMKDVFALENTIAQAVVDTLDIKLTVPLPKAIPTDAEAFDSYLQGRSWYFKETPEDVRRAIPFFEQAIQKDYAPAYSALADAHIWLARAGSDPREEFSQARAASDKAIQIDPRSLSAYVDRAEARALGDYDWGGAQSDFARALAIDPSSAVALSSHAFLYLAPSGRTQDASEEIKRALDTDPLNPTIVTELGSLYLFDQQNQAAISQLRKALELAPDLAEAHRMLFLAELSAENKQEARSELIRLKDGDPGLNRARELLIDGHNQEAIQVLREGEPAPSEIFSLAMTYFGLGDLKDGFDELDQAYRDRDPMLVFLKVWPGLDPVRRDPGFQAMLAKLHLAP